MINTFDFLNFFFIFNILLLLFVFKTYDLKFFLVLSITTLSPFFIHQIIPPSTMGDQFFYYDLIKNFRGLNFDKSKILCHWCSDINATFYGGGSGFVEYYDPRSIQFDNNTSISAIIYSIVPIPFIESLASIGLINKSIYLIFIIYFLKNKTFNKYILFILIIYPSALFYSSLALRDTLVVFCMVFYIYNFLEKRYLFSILFIVVLFLIKFQNAFILITLSTLYLIIFQKKFRLFLVSFIILFSYINSNKISNYYNKIESTKYALFVQNIIQSHPGDVIKQNQLINEIPDYNAGKSIIKFNLLEIMKTPFYFMFMPKPSEIKNLFHYFQFIENLIMVLFLLAIIYFSFKSNKNKTFFWIFGLLFSFYLYGIVSYNIGTVARYRFPFIVFFIFTFYYDCIFIKNKEIKWK